MKVLSWLIAGVWVCFMIIPALTGFVFRFLKSWFNIGYSLGTKVEDAIK